MAVPFLPISKETLIYGRFGFKRHSIHYYHFFFSLSIVLKKSNIFLFSQNKSEPVVDTDPYFKKLMKELAKKLNLAKHNIVFYNSRHNVISKGYLYTCADMEGHQSLVRHISKITF
jgi:hypothetical protein